jgi:O-antigen/teichoic acid export membrane protein
LKTNQLKAGATLSYASMGIGSLISIMYTPIMLRLLGQSEYGLYTLASSIVGYLGLLSFGFGSAYVRFYSRYKVDDKEQEIARLNGLFITVFSLIAVVAILVGLALVMNLESMLGQSLTPSELEKTKTLMLILVINIAITFPASVFNSFITANEQFLYQKIVNIIQQVVNPLIVLPALLLGFASVGMVIATLILNLVVYSCNIYYCFKRLKMKVCLKSFEFGLFKEIAVFSSYIVINMIVDQINWNIDKFLLGIYKGTVAVAIYGLAAQLNIYYMTFATAVPIVFIPKVHGLVAKANDNQVLTELLARVGRVQFIIISLICSGFVIFGQPFIEMWVGKNYEDSYLITLLLIIPVTIPNIQYLGIEIQRAKNMHQFRSWVYLFIAVCNVCLSIPLCKLYGGIGCAIGTAISLLIGNGLIMNWYYHKRVGLDMKYFWKQIMKFMPSLLPSAVIGILMFMFVDLYRIIPFLTWGSIYVVVFCVSMWFLGMNQYEKDLIGKPVLRVLRKLRVCK